MYCKTITRVLILVCVSNGVVFLTMSGVLLKQTVKTHKSCAQPYTRKQINEKGD